MKLTYEFFLALTLGLGGGPECPLHSHDFLFLSNLKAVGHRSSSSKVPIRLDIASILPFALFQ